MPKTRGVPLHSTVPTRSSPRKKRGSAELLVDDITITHELENADVLPTTNDPHRPSKRVRIAKSSITSIAPPVDDASQSSAHDDKPASTDLEDEEDQIHIAPKPKARTPKKKQHKETAVGAEPRKHAQAVHHESTTKPATSTAPNGDEKLGKPDKGSRKRKTREEKEAEAMPLASRTPGLNMFVGAHVSIAKGLENAITNSLHIGGNAFALFLKSQRKWENPALKDENREAFKQHCTHHKYDQSSHVVPHGSYLVNLASPDKDMAKKSYDAFLDDMRRCEALGIRYYNFHPGSTNKEPLDEAIDRLVGNLNRALAETTTVTPLLENMAGHGTIIGSRFSDLRDIIAAIKPEFKSRIGICLDTCHAFAAGYDLRSPEAYQKTFEELDKVVGLKYLKALHMNDSKAPYSSHRDLHQNIGVGFLGLRAFHNIMNDSRLENVPLILETPCEKPDPDNPKKTIDDKTVWAREIKLLESLIGMDPASEEFKKLEKELSKQGQAEREKMEMSIKVRDDKARKKAEKALEKGQKSISAMFGSKSKGKKRGGSTSSTSSLSDAASDV